MIKFLTISNKYKHKIIRFKKKGIINYPLYEIIVAFNNSRNKGKSIEKIGFYNPQKKNKSININNYRLSFWLLQGVHINFSLKKYLVKFIIN